MSTVVEGHRQIGEDYSIAYSREIDKVGYACHIYGTNQNKLPVAYSYNSGSTLRRVITEDT